MEIVGGMLVALVVLTVFLFLHGWRPTIIPVIAIPISLIGTFAAMQVLGRTSNRCTRSRGRWTTTCYL